MKIINYTKKYFPEIIEDLNNYDKKINEENIIKELEYLLYKCNCDGIEYHLNNDIILYNKLVKIINKHK